MTTSRGIAVVTGAANGIRQAYARRLAADGFDIAVADIVEAAATRALVEAEGRKFLSSIVDVASPADPVKFAVEVERALGPVSALVNNAGIYLWKSFEDTRPTQDGLGFAFFWSVVEKNESAICEGIYRRAALVAVNQEGE